MNNILITGGTGSLGNALIRRILDEPEPVYDKIIIYSRCEHKQEQQKIALCKEGYSVTNLRWRLGNVRDYDRLDLAVSDGVSTIVNAAAYKIVTRGEDDCIEFKRTNCDGPEIIIRLAIKQNIRKILQISTDKAVQPINLYGASKMMAEKMMAAANNIKGEKGPIFGYARYGNVLGSNGSVVPKFIEWYKENKPFQITHQDMTRFVITLSQAADFVFNSLQRMNHNEYTFIPKMKAHTVLDLAKAIGGNDYPIEYIGIRPGEKIHELLSIDPLVSSETSERMSIRELQSLLKLEGLI